MPGDCWIKWNSVVRTHIFSDRLILAGSDTKLCYLLPSWDMSFHGEVRGGEYHESQDQWISKGGLSLSGDEEFAWWFMIHSSSMQVGAATWEKFKVLPFRMKIQGLTLISCAWQ
jgi:hypothetical protein